MPDPQAPMMRRLGIRRSEVKSSCQCDSQPKSKIAPRLDGIGVERWEGVSRKRSWEYRVSATLAVFEPSDSLDAVIQTLRNQTERPYIIIVDTGSRWESLQKLYCRYDDDEDIEIHALRSRGWRHSSAPVGAALDVALAVCHSEFLYLTHDDVFLKKASYIADLIKMYEEEPNVAIGYQMSPRDWLTDQWEGMVSHTATLCHAPTLRKIGASWSFERSHDQFGVPRGTMGWPDTETAFGLLLRSLGMRPKLIGEETNYVRFEDDNLVHCRSYTGSRLYSGVRHAEAKAEVASEIVRVKRESGVK